REQLERHVGLELCRVHPAIEPGPLEGPPAERIAALPGEGMPIGDGKAQMLFHPLAQNDLVGVVMAERQRIGAVGAFVTDLVQPLEKIAHDARASSMPRYKAR